MPLLLLGNLFGIYFSLLSAFIFRIFKTLARRVGCYLVTTSSEFAKQEAKGAEMELEGAATELEGAVTELEAGGDGVGGWRRRNWRGRGHC